MRYGIFVVDAGGTVMPLREGAEPGEGPIARFPNRAKAAKVAEDLKPGLDEGEQIFVGPLGQPWIPEDHH